MRFQSIRPGAHAPFAEGPFTYYATKRDHFKILKHTATNV